MQQCFTVLLPVIRPPVMLPYAIESVLAQSLASFELFIICDGAPEQTVACAHDYAAKDSRVKVFDFPKSIHVGEEHRHTALATAAGRYIAHIGDDDLWFPNHLEVMERALRKYDFCHTLHVAVHVDGSVEALAADLENAEFRERMLKEHFNRFGDPVAGYRLDAYRRLPEGWTPTPAGLWPDLAMWRKFLRRQDLAFGTRMAITALVFWTEERHHMSLEERGREVHHWHTLVQDADKRDEIEQAAWRSLIHKNIQFDAIGTELEKMTTSRDHLQAELGQMTALRDHFQAELQRVAASRDHLQVELGQVTALRDHFQAELASTTNSREHMRAELQELKVEHAAARTRLALVTSANDKCQSDLLRITQSRSWRLISRLHPIVARGRFLIQALRDRLIRNK